MRNPGRKRQAAAVRPQYPRCAGFVHARAERLRNFIEQPVDGGKRHFVDSDGLGITPVLGMRNVTVTGPGGGARPQEQAANTAFRWPVLIDVIVGADGAAVAVYAAVVRIAVINGAAYFDIVLIWL